MNELSPMMQELASDVLNLRGCGPCRHQRTSCPLLDDQPCGGEEGRAMREYIGKISEDIKFLRKAPHSAEAIDDLKRLSREAAELAFKKRSRLRRRPRAVGATTEETEQ